MMAGRRAAVVAAVVLAGGTGCVPKSTPASSIESGATEGAGTRVDLVQGWTQRQRDLWYAGTQGSRLVPYAWAKALESASGTDRFFSPARFAGYRYLPAERTSKTGLPIGFALDDGDDRGLRRTNLRWYAGQGSRELYLGMNCSACHTGEIAFKGKTMRVDGGATLADMQTFVEEFDAALTATRSDPAKFARFAAAVLGAKDNPANRALLTTALDRLIAWETVAARANATPLRYGHARLDAFGRIFTKVAANTGAADQIVNPADAPVSYPFLWNTHQADKVQWNGIASNNQLHAIGTFDYGALGRNVGEVTGVFGDVVVTPNANVITGYRSSVQVQSIEALERLLATLKPPAWPASVFGAPDAGAVAAGRTLFARDCAGCHTSLARDDLKSQFKVKMSLFQPGIAGNTPPGTDPWMACNAYTYEAKTGAMAGTKRGLVSGAPLGPVEPVANLLRTSVVGTIAGQKGATIGTAITTFAGLNLPPRIVTETEGVRTPEQLRAMRLARCMREPADILGYKGRPLTGIWATAPYLHNGSVPTLYDLLLPPAQRPKTFAVGDREYDPVKVGYVGGPFRFDTGLRGNSNAGHDYDNAALTGAQRTALVAYMKTL